MSIFLIQKRLVLVITACLALLLAIPAFAETSHLPALKELVRQLDVWYKAKRHHDIKIVSTHGEDVNRQIRRGHVNLQKIVDNHNYNHKDGRYYGKKKPRNSAQPGSKPTTDKANNRRPVAVRRPTQIPEANKPVMAVTRLEGYIAKMDLYFRNGNTVGCSNWDPTKLNPTAESVGRRIKGCKVSRGQPKGKRLKKFNKGETLDIVFENISAGGYDWIDSSSSQISGSNLRMAKNGRIAISKYRTTSISSGGHGVNARSKPRSIEGRYALDGHTITIRTNSGEMIYGFVGAASNTGSNRIDHIYVNGVHYWNSRK